MTQLRVDQMLSAKSTSHPSALSSSHERPNARHLGKPGSGQSLVGLLTHKKARPSYEERAFFKVG